MTRKIRIGLGNHPDNFVSPEEFDALVQEAIESGERRRQMEAERALCDAGMCDHYTCTEGRSLDDWDEPEPTRWDYESEAFGPTARDADDFFNGDTT